MENHSIDLSDFTFKPSGYGHYKVTYHSRTTNKNWSTVTSNMPLIDLTKNQDYPMKKDLNSLKVMCKKQNRY